MSGNLGRGGHEFGKWEASGLSCDHTRRSGTMSGGRWKNTDMNKWWSDLQVSEHASWSALYYERIIQAALAAAGAPSDLVQVFRLPA